MTQEEIDDLKWEIESDKEWEQWREENGIPIIMPPLRRFFLWDLIDLLLWWWRS